MKVLESSTKWNKELSNYVEEQKSTIDAYEKEIRNLKDTKSNLKVCQTQLEEHNEKCNKYEFTISDYLKQLNEYKDEIVLLRRKNNELEERIISTPRNDETINQEEAYRRDFQDMIFKTEEEVKLQRLQEEKKFQKIVAELNEKIAKLEVEKKEVEEEREQCKADIVSLKQNAEVTINTMTKTEMEKVRILEKSISNLKAELNAEKQKNEALNNNIKVLEEIVQATKAQLEVAIKQKDDINMVRMAELQKDHDILAIKSELNQVKVRLL